MSLRSGDHVLVVHPYGVAHRARCTGRVIAEPNAWQVVWLQPPPARSPYSYFMISADGEGVYWLFGHDHPEATVNALCAAAALARGAPDA